MRPAGLDPPVSLCGVDGVEDVAIGPMTGGSMARGDAIGDVRPRVRLGDGPYPGRGVSEPVLDGTMYNEFPSELPVEVDWLCARFTADLGPPATMSDEVCDVVVVKSNVLEESLIVSCGVVLPSRVPRDR